MARERSEAFQGEEKCGRNDDTGPLWNKEAVILSSWWVRENSEGQGWEAGRGEDGKTPDVLWVSLPLSGITGEQLRDGEQQAA